MSFWENIPGIFTTVKDIIRNFVKDPNDADKLAAEITSAFADIVKTELGSRHWLAANWRAIVMLLIAASMTIKTVFSMDLITIDYVLFGLLVMGLLGYKLDGKILEFIAQLFKFGKEQAEGKGK
jgi:hypothetical protein